MKSVLYLLVNEEKSSFKIGITDNIKSRHARLRAAWGDFDLASSRMVTGARQDITGLERTLHYLLEKWRIRPLVKAEGHSEWFAMTCFDKALEIISDASNLRDLRLDDLTIGDISGNFHRKKTRRTRSSYDTQIKFDDLKNLFSFYEIGTLDFRDHPYVEEAWLWTVDVGECKIDPFDAMRFQLNGIGINLISSVCNEVNEPSIIQIEISKTSLLDMGKHVVFRQAYEFVSSKINSLISSIFYNNESFDIESTPVFQSSL